MGKLEREKPIEVLNVPEALPLMGVKVTPFNSYEHVIGVVSGLLELREKAYIAAINPEKIFPVHTENPQLCKSSSGVTCIIEQAKEYIL